MDSAVGMCRANKHQQSGGPPGDSLPQWLPNHPNHKVSIWADDKVNKIASIEVPAATVRKSNQRRRGHRINRTIAVDVEVQG